MIRTAKEIANYFRGAAMALPAEMLKAETENARDALVTIIEYSSGEISAAELAALGHPYAPGRTPPQDPAIINVQTAEFLNAWHQDGPKVQPDGSVKTVFENMSDHARFLETGTYKMIPRPLVERVEEIITPRLDVRREAAALRAFGVRGEK